MTQGARVEVPSADPIRALVSLALLLAFSWWIRCAIDADRNAFAGDRPPRARRQVIIRGQPFPSEIVLLVDGSGSMHMGDGLAYALAVDEAATIALQASDGARARFAWFAGGLVWEPQGWIQLPDRDAVQKAHGWLQQNGDGGGTNLVEAMERVLALPEAPLGVVIFTDEDSAGGPGPDAQKIASLNAERKGGPAVIGVVSILPTNPHHEQLGRGLARTGGAYLKLTMPKEDGERATR